MTPFEYIGDMFLSIEDQANSKKNASHMLGLHFKFFNLTTDKFKSF